MPSSETYARRESYFGDAGGVDDGWMRVKGGCGLAVGRRHGGECGGWGYRDRGEGRDRDSVGRGVGCVWDEQWYQRGIGIIRQTAILLYDPHPSTTEIIASTLVRR